MVNKNLYSGLFFITLSTLMYEILLTRIFSVTMWYHFAFVAISIGMFGMTAGACLIYLFPKFFSQEKVFYHLSISSLLFSITIIFSFLTHLSIPFVSTNSLVSFYSTGLNYFVVSIPFIFSGIAVTLALTKFPEKVGKLYAADLAGAAIGCIALIFVLNLTGDGPTTVFVVAFFASLSAFFFAYKKYKGIIKSSLIFSICLLIFIGVNTYLANNQKAFIKLTFVKGAYESKSDYEKWNSFSRIKIYPDYKEYEKIFGWGISSVFPKESIIKQKCLDIDANAATFLTRFNGNFDSVSHLKYDVTNIVHYIRNNGNILIVGAGGGRDVLSALLFGQKSVDAVEINENIINAINGPYGDYTGHLNKYPNVRFINDEARSFIARTNNKYDIIQVSLIDTWAATAAGAFVMTENSLYTTEAWNIMLNKLSPHGIISFSRWYFRDKRSEMYRLVALAASSLKQFGVKDLRRHLLIIRNYKDDAKINFLDEGIGTLLTSITPFTDADLDSLEKTSKKLEFDVVLSPRICGDSTFISLTSGNISEFTTNYPLNIIPPTDDNPYFFHLLRLKNIINPDSWNVNGLSHNYKAVLVLGSLLIVVILLTILCIIIPLRLGSKNISLKGSLPLFLYFMGIGFGFMFIEISQMQRLIIFLGHPVYGLSVVLFALLLSSGIGSLFTERLEIKNQNKRRIVSLSLLLLMLISFGIVTPYIVSNFQSSTTTVRIFASVCILIPPGFFMGMAFPIGMKTASKRAIGLTSWLWGINGAASVCASVLAVVIAMSSGISTTYWLGFLCYGLAFGSYIWTGRSE